MGVSLYTSRIVLNSLGVVDFGIYNVVGGIVIMLGFLNSALSASTLRFLSFEMGTANLQNVIKVFRISFTIHFIIAILILILAETIGLWFLNTQLNIPSDRMIAANWVYQFSVFSFIVSVLNIPNSSILIAHERMSIYAYISIVEAIFKLIIVFILGWTEFDKLITYAFLIFFVTTIVSLFYTIYCIKNFKECNYRFLMDKEEFSKMSSFASWNLIGVFAGLGLNQGVSVLLNIFFGPTVNAARGIAFQIQGSVNAFVSNFQVAVNPQITKSYAARDTEHVLSLVIKSSKYSFFLLLLLSLPVLVETKYVLLLWLKIVPDYSVIFTRLTLLDVLICSLSGSLHTYVQATGKVKIYQIVVSGILLLNLPIAYLFLHLGLQPQSVFIVSIFISFFAMISRVVILNILAKFPFKIFIKEVLLPVVLVSVISFSASFFISSLMHDSLERFFIVTFLSVLLVILTTYFFGTNKDERIQLMELIYKKLPFIKK
ncbi:lipopolysaccharide biosynthesis protein [Chryseobacterium sp. GP-SGM7]|uniref:lipopolysaccharide biosynthesis protein n=1 Tax=Chryseobacterium sp. GP-SGM7 TaxID=3411323 RepID=UPI003B950C05